MERDILNNFTVFTKLKGGVGIPNAQKSQVKSFSRYEWELKEVGQVGWGYGGDSEGLLIVGSKVDGARWSKGARKEQEETLEAWVGP